VSNARAGFMGLYARVSGKSGRCGWRVASARLFWGLSAAVSALASLSCGSSHATLVITAPASVVAGAPFSATVTAMYEGKVDTVIDGPIHFTTSDKAAALPTLYVFTSADAGSHTFDDLVLVTPGNQTMTVSDYDASPIAGTVNIAVLAPSSEGR
jgi:hypothetical protein